MKGLFISIDSDTWTHGMWLFCQIPHWKKNSICLPYFSSILKFPDLFNKDKISKNNKKENEKITETYCISWKLLSPVYKHIIKPWPF